MSQPVVKTRSVERTLETQKLEVPVVSELVEEGLKEGLGRHVQPPPSRAVMDADGFRPRAVRGVALVDRPRVRVESMRSRRIQDDQFRRWNTRCIAEGRNESQAEPLPVGGIRRRKNSERGRHGYGTEINAELASLVRSSIVDDVHSSLKIHRTIERGLAAAASGPRHHGPMLGWESGTQNVAESPARARSSVAEQSAHNRSVAGSNPAGPTIVVILVFSEVPSRIARDKRAGRHCRSDRFAR